MTRRRVVLSALVAAMVAAGCAGGGASAGGDAGTRAAQGMCQEGERPPLQSGGHLLGEGEPPVPYSSTPATSGWHSSVRPATGVHGTPLRDPEIVSILEGGGVVAAYDRERLSADEVARLEALATDAHPERLTVAPYAGDMPTPVVLLAWGVLQRCDGVDPAAVTAFVLEHHGGVGDDH